MAIFKDEYSEKIERITDNIKISEKQKISSKNSPEK